MTYSSGYAGSILRVDLTTGGTERVPTERYSDLFLGGRGIAAKIYWDEVRPGTDPFDPENRLIFVTGPVQLHRSPEGRYGRQPGRHRPRTGG